MLLATWSLIVNLPEALPRQSETVLLDTHSVASRAMMDAASRVLRYHAGKLDGRIAHGAEPGECPARRGASESAPASARC